MKTCIILSLSFALFFFSCERTVVQPEEKNVPPEILSLTADQTSVYAGENIHLFCVAVDADDNQLSYEWMDGGAGVFNSNGVSSVVWEAPQTDHDFSLSIIVIVRDEEESVTKSILINVLAPDVPEEPEIFEIDLPLTDDSFVDSEYPDANFGYESYLSAGVLYREGSNSFYSYPYLKFDLSDLPSNISIVAAKLNLFVGFNNTLEKPVGDIYLFGVENNDWEENALTFNNCPQRNELVIGIIRNVTFDVSSVQTFDVREYLEEHYNSDFCSFTIFVENEELWPGYFYSKESGYPSKLSVKYALQ